MLATMESVKRANMQWFDKGNKKFFGDRSYSVLYSKTGKPYLLRSTYAWSDMFGKQKTLTYRINKIDPETLKIGSMVDVVFETRAEAKDYIKHDYPELLDKQRQLIDKYLQNCGYSLSKAIDEKLRTCGQIPILIDDYRKYVYPEYGKTLDELLSM